MPVYVSHFTHQERTSLLSLFYSSLLLMADFASFMKIMDDQIKAVNNQRALYATLYFDEMPQFSLPPYIPPYVSSSSSRSPIYVYPNPETVKPNNLETGNDQLSEPSEGLASERSDVEGSYNESKTDDEKVDFANATLRESSRGGSRRSRHSPKTYPPPLSSLGLDGRPLYFFKSLSENGRHEMKMFKHPPRPYIVSYRENGRLRMFLIPPKEDAPLREWDLETGEYHEEGPVKGKELVLGDHEAEEGGAGERKPELGDHEAEEGTVEEREPELGDHEAEEGEGN